MVGTPLRETSCYSALMKESMDVWSGEWGIQLVCFLI